MIHAAFFSSEVTPFAKTGGMADVCGALPLALERLGVKVTILMPLYRGIDWAKYGIQKNHPSFAETSIGEAVQVLFIEHNDFFYRDGLYGNSRGDYRDNLDRFQFFCRRGMEILKETGRQADILHCHDWPTALVPVYLKTLYAKDRFYSNTKSVLTIHNLAFQGVFPREQYGKIGLDGHFFNDTFEFYGKINLLKAGILCSPALTTVSPQYAREIQTREFGWGLEGVLASRKDQLVGILNGIDQETWNPETDPWIQERYSAQDLSGKAVDKTALQKICGLKNNGDIPLLAFVGRISQQKGIDILIPALENILSHHNIQVVILGTGEDRYHGQFQRLAARFKDKISLHLKFDEILAHKIYAGSDIFLMPSGYEPCGLSQMISLRYGTIPLVHHTGGLADTVTPFDQQGNGFVFYEYHVAALAQTMRRALEVFSDKAVFHSLVEKAFQYHFPWEISARHYLDLYQGLKETKKS